MTPAQRNARSRARAATGGGARTNIDLTAEGNRALAFIVAHGSAIGVTSKKDAVNRALCELARSLAR